MPAEHGRMKPSNDEANNAPPRRQNQKGRRVYRGSVLGIKPAGVGGRGGDGSYSYLEIYIYVF